MGFDNGFIYDRVSVVTPVYNGEKRLHRLLDSILAQSWDHIEMILVDDGSWDGTLRIAETYRKKFQDRGFSYHIVSAEHRSASAAINSGLLLVTGEFLVWPDSDDALDPDSIQKRVRFLRMNPQYQCVRSLGCYLNEQGEPAKAREKRGDLKNEQLFFPILEGETFVCCGCYMLRTEIFFSIYPQRRIPEYEVGQNFQMLLPFMYFHPCPTIEEELYTVYIHLESHSSRVLTQEQEEKKFGDYEDMIDKLAEICGISDKEERRRISLWKQKRRFWLYGKYGQKYKASLALCRIYCYGGITFKEFIRVLLKKLYGPKSVLFFQKLKRIVKRIIG